MADPRQLCRRDGLGAPHVGKELRLARLGASDAELDAIRAAAEADAARKAGDHSRARWQEELTASYQTLGTCYRQRERVFAQTMGDREEWEQATAGSRRLAIAADAELRRRHPDQKIEPLRSAEPTPVSDAERERQYPAPDGIGHTTAWVRDLAPPPTFRTALTSRQGMKEPSNGLGWSELGGIFSAGRPPWRDAILQPPKPQITPSARILQLTAEPDTEPEAAD